jgi:hypothetical protein
VDATILHAPTSTKNRQQQRDPERIDEVERAKNRPKSRVRSKVEHVFAVMKLKFGLVKLRYRGLKKNGNQLFAVCALVNLYLRGRSAAASGSGLAPQRSSLNPSGAPKRAATKKTESEVTVARDWRTARSAAEIPRDAERWKGLDDLLQSALELPADQQDEFLRQACARDTALQESQSLLTSPRRVGSFSRATASKNAVPYSVADSRKETSFTMHSLFNDTYCKQNRHHTDHVASYDQPHPGKCLTTDCQPFTLASNPPKRLSHMTAGNTKRV